MEDFKKSVLYWCPNIRVWTFHSTSVPYTCTKWMKVEGAAVRRCYVIPASHRCAKSEGGGVGWVLHEHSFWGIKCCLGISLAGGEMHWMWTIVLLSRIRREMVWHACVMFISPTEIVCMNLACGQFFEWIVTIFNRSKYSPDWKGVGHPCVTCGGAASEFGIDFMGSIKIDSRQGSI